MSIVDLHCDTISAILDKAESLWENTCHFDIKRARQAGIGIQFFALFTMPADSNIALRQILKQVEKFYLELEKNQQYLYQVKSRLDSEECKRQGKIGCVLHLEGGEALGTDIEVLRLLYRLGLRSMGLTWNHRNLLADGVREGDSAGGISKLGREVIREMETLGIMLDLSHAAENTFYQALEHYHKPVLVTHANARALCNHPRNLTDRQLKALAENGGIIGINQVADFVKEGTPGVDDLIDHIVYMAELIGVEHLALGSDFDGADSIVMPGVEAYANWESLLERRNFKPQEIRAIMETNALGVIRQVLK